MPETRSMNAKPSPRKSSTRKKPARLPNLPIELIELILEDVYAHRVLADPLCKALLPLYRHLVWTRIEIKSGGSLERLLAHLRQRSQSASAITAVSIDIDNRDRDRTDIGDYLSRFLAIAANVSDLTLEGFNRYGGSLTWVRDQVASPAKLETLMLDGRAGSSLKLSLLTTLLHRLTSLSTLHLSGSLLWTEPAFLASLHRLPLQRIILGSGLPVDKQAILALVEPSDLLRSLKRLNLSMFKAEPRLTAAECHDDSREMEDSWTTPVYPPTLPREAIEECIAAVEEKGIEVDGAVLRALSIEDDFYEQRKELLEYLRETWDKKGARWLQHVDSDYEPGARNAASR
ncbi:hypothetical protein JCM11641_005926 [Rhodosporidiobolus odoratus]